MLQLHVNIRNSAQLHNGHLCSHGYQTPMSNQESVARKSVPDSQSKSIEAGLLGLDANLHITDIILD